MRLRRMLRLLALPTKGWPIAECFIAPDPFSNAVCSVVETVFLVEPTLTSFERVAHLHSMVSGHKMLTEHKAANKYCACHRSNGGDVLHFENTTTASKKIANSSEEHLHVTLDQELKKPTSRTTTFCPCFFLNHNNRIGILSLKLRLGKANTQVSPGPSNAQRALKNVLGEHLNTFRANEVYVQLLSHATNSASDLSTQSIPKLPPARQSVPLRRLGLTA